MADPNAAKLYRADITYYLGGVFVASYATESYTTGPTASIANPNPNTYYDGRLLQPLLISRNMYDEGSLIGSSNINTAVVQLSDSDGALDDFYKYALDGRSLKIWEVDRDTFTDKELVFNGTMEQPSFDDKIITIQGRDVAHIWDVPAQPVKYAGNNVLPAGVEGVTDIKAQPKPIGLGVFWNARPKCVNTSLYIYQFDSLGFNTGWTASIFDQRVSIPQGSVYATQADLENPALAPAAGQCRIYPAKAMVRYGSKPTLPTGDIVNPAPGFGGSSALTTIMATIGNYAGIPWPGLGMPEVDYLITNPPCGIYVTEEQTVLELRKELARSVNMFQCPGRDQMGVTSGQVMIVSQLTAPEFMPIPLYPTYGPEDRPGVLPLDESNILPGTFKRLIPGGETRGLPVWRVNVNYAKNYTVMQGSDFALGVSTADQELWSKEYRTATASDPSVLTSYPGAPELNVYSAIAYEADAQAEASRLLSLFGIARFRNLFTLQIKGETARAVPSKVSTYSTLYRVSVQSLVQLTLPGRFGLDDATRRFIVVGVTENLKTDVYTLIIWGG